MDMGIRRNSNTLIRILLLIALLATYSCTENKQQTAKQDEPIDNPLPAPIDERYKDRLVGGRPDTMAEPDTTTEETQESTTPVYPLLLSSILAFSIIVYIKYRKEKKKNKLLNKKIEDTQFIGKLYKLMSEDSANLEKEVSSISINYGLKEKSQGYHLIQKAVKSTKKQTHENLYMLSTEFLEKRLPGTKAVKILNSTDLILVSLTICKHEFKDTANLLGVTPNALHMRKQRLKEKLKNAGISEEE